MLPVVKTQGDRMTVFDKLIDEGKVPESLAVARFYFQGDDICTDDVLQASGCIHGDDFSSIDDADPLAEVVRLFHVVGG